MIVLYNSLNIYLCIFFWPAESNLASIWNAQSGPIWNQVQSVLFFMILYQSGMTQSGIPIHDSKPPGNIPATCEASLKLQAIWVRVLPFPVWFLWQPGCWTKLVTEAICLLEQAGLEGNLDKPSQSEALRNLIARLMFPSLAPWTGWLGWLAGWL